MNDIVMAKKKILYISGSCGHLPDQRRVPMPENVYVKLRELLDTHPVGCHSSPEIIEILKIHFSKEEARVALGLGFTLFNTDEIAYETKVDQRGTGYIRAIIGHSVLYGCCQYPTQTGFCGGQVSI